MRDSRGGSVSAQGRVHVRGSRGGSVSVQGRLCVRGSRQGLSQHVRAVGVVEMVGRCTPITCFRGVHDWDSGFRSSGFGLRVKGSGFRFSGFVFSVKCG